MPIRLRLLIDPLRRCGNSASILEVRPGGQGQEIQDGDMYFNVFEAAPENDRDGPGQQASMNAGGKVCELSRSGTIDSDPVCYVYRSCRSTFCSVYILI